METHTEVHTHIDTAFCPLYQRTVELIGRRWTGAILRAMLSGITRYSELRHVIPDLTDRMLSERLKELEEQGIVERRVIPQTPVRIDYVLTPKGQSLGTVVEAISGWADQWLPGTETPIGAVSGEKQG